MQSTLSTIVVLIGIALMAACGSQIARHMVSSNGKWRGMRPAC
jgi:hypothetical protein